MYMNSLQGHFAVLTKFSRRAALMCTLLALTSFAVSADRNDSEAQQLHWVTTWSMSPSTLPPGFLPQEQVVDAFENRTIRLIAHSSVGGEMVRVRISNTHGDKRLKVGSATIALQTTAADISVETLTKLTFGGEESITIARGGLVLSDPVSFAVPALSNLSVSLYLPEGSGTATSHVLSMETSYLSAAGNHTSDESLQDPQELTEWQFVSAIDVGRRDEMTAIVTLGDSITDGYGSNRSLNNRWPNYLARRLVDDDGVPRFAVVNAGISGNRVLHESNIRFGENLQVRFERDVLALSSISHIVLLEGINDLGMSVAAPEQEVNALEVIAGYKQIIARAHANGIKIIGATLTPFEGAAYYTAEGERKRQAINEWIRTSDEFDGVIDFEKPVQDPANHTRLLPSYTTDNLHPNDAGYEAMAAAIDLSLFE